MGPRILGQVLLWISLAALPGAAGASSSVASIEAVGVPSGFEELTSVREMLADIYFAGRKITEARITARPGYIRFEDPEIVIEAIPSLVASPRVRAALASYLSANVESICPQQATTGCGVLRPETIGVIFDESRFRVDVFINSSLLEYVGAPKDLYLATPTAPVSLTSSIGATLSGSSRSSTLYNVQNRTIVAFRNARIRSESSYASNFGLQLDSIVGEIDSQEFRYWGGMFWAPGTDLTGHRRILGLGMASQFDTRADRDLLHGTPLVLFLTLPARVDILVDGRLVGSGLYEAGNNILDTSTMPDGSYAVTLRIQDRTGAVREERRFFTKSAKITPVGETQLFAFAGLLTNNKPSRLLSVAEDPFYQFGIARRLSERLAIDAMVIGTARKIMLEVGAWVITPVARFRSAGLVSAKGDLGGMVQVASARTGRLTLSLDARQVWSRDGQPLIPLPTYVATFDSVPLDDFQLGEGSYAQITGSVGYRFGKAYAAVIGSLRKDEGRPIDYSIGPSLNWPLVSKGGLHVAIHADAQVTRATTSALVGVRVLLTAGDYSVSSSLGRRKTSDGADSRSDRWGNVTSIHAQYSRRLDEQTEFALTGGVDREVRSTVGRAGGTLNSRFGHFRGELLHDFEGGMASQYALTLQSGAAINPREALVGGRNLDESAIIVSVDGTAKGVEFEVLVDEQPRGRVEAGARLPIFLPAYRAYSLRLRSVDSAPVWYETTAREVVLYPGNVEDLAWVAESVVTVFGRAVRSDGKPVANAAVTARRSSGHTDDNGYFQVDVTGEELLAFESSQQGKCVVSLDGRERSGDITALGKVVCR